LPAGGDAPPAGLPSEESDSVMVANDALAWFIVCGDEGEFKVSGPFESREHAIADIELNGCQERHAFRRGPLDVPYELPCTSAGERERHVARAMAARSAQ
jgi:hypothetical protein